MLNYADMRQRAEDWQKKRFHMLHCDCILCKSARDVLALLVEVERKDKALEAVLANGLQGKVAEHVCGALAPLPEEAAR